MEQIGYPLGAQIQKRLLLASSDTPVSTTSTSGVDLIVISGLSIPATSTIVLEYGPSKDALAAAWVNTGFKLNATAVNSNVNIQSSSITQAEDGFVVVRFMPRSTAAPNGVLTTFAWRVTSNGSPSVATSSIVVGVIAMPLVLITSVTITGYNQSSNNNLTIEWFRLWEYSI